VVRNALRATAFAVALTTLIACGKPGEAAGTKGDPADPTGSRGAGTKGAEGASGGGRTGTPGRGGRGATSVVLGPNDVALVKKGTIESALAIQGDLKPIEEIAVRARVEGNIEQALVREGDRVARGQVMARFENSNQESARKSAVADLESAKADLTNSQWNADQSEQLFKAGAIPERDLRTAQQTLVASQARLAAAEAKLRSTSQDLEDTRVLSPTTGVVSDRNVEAGEHVTRGSTVFTVVRNDMLELDASVPARFAGDVRPSQPVRFFAGGRELNGKVARVNPTIDPASRSVTVYLQVPNPDGTLKGNTFATGRIIAQQLTDALIIPTGAIRYQQTQPKPLVYRIANDAIEFATIDLGIVDEVSGIAQVTNGLSEGDRIIVGNIGALGRGVKVTIARAPEQGGGRGRPVEPGGRQRGGGGGGGDSTRVRQGRGKGGDNPVPKPPNG
jgi:RND family efflux transporter MFP subunit